MARKKRKPTRPSKSKCQTIHFGKRLQQRYGIKADRNLNRAIVSKIIRCESTFVSRQSNRISIHDVWIRKQMIRVVYDSLRKIPVTALPPELIKTDPANFYPACHDNTAEAQIAA